MGQVSELLLWVGMAGNEGKGRRGKGGEKGGEGKERDSSLSGNNAAEGGGRGGTALPGPPCQCLGLALATGSKPEPGRNL